MGSSMALGSDNFLPKPRLYAARDVEARQSIEPAAGKGSRLIAKTTQPVVTASLAADTGKAARHPVARGDARADATARFDAIVKQADLTSAKLAALLDRSAKSRNLTAKAHAPTPERFASLPTISTVQPRIMLAYADPTPGAAGAALSALLTPKSEDDLAASQGEDTGEDIIALPTFEDTPSDAPLPGIRPRNDVAARPDGETAKPDARQAEKPARTEERQTQKPQALAYARPNDPVEKRGGGGLGQTLRNLFGGGTRAGNGVAVYDISAAKVYMPDGSVLEAHSGVGKMADNPRYANVKMNGPTPPHTYNLKMRESRFHGVEAIRMLPADGKNKYGRDGFLTHSYLLRGRPGESHGCVAFKDYDRFLNAFKKGKVKQIIVVPSGGRGTMLASNGNST